MVYDPTLLDRLETVTREEFDGVVWRHMFGSFDPARANTRGARWNPPGVAAIYTSIDKHTALAEAEHAIASQPMRPRAERKLYQIRVTVKRLIRCDEVLLSELGVGKAELQSVNHTACQRVGGACHWLQADGLLVPSARAAGLNLVVFADNLDVDAAFEVVASEEVPA